MPKQILWTDRLMVPIAHFSHALRIDDLIHVGATAGTDAKRRLAGATPGLIEMRAQTEKMFDNLETVLHLLGAGLDNVVRIKTYVADPRDIGLYRTVHQKRVGNVRHSHAIVGSWGFPLPQAAIELDAVAVRGATVLTGDDPAGVRVGDTHYATALPHDRSGGTTSSDAEGQSRQALHKVFMSLSAAGLSPQEVVSVHVTLSDIRHFAAFETAFTKAFRPPYPARTIVAAPLEEPEVSVQIESIAVAGGGQPVVDRDWPDVVGCASPAILAGDALYVSGQLGVGPDGIIETGAQAQTRTAWRRVHRLIEHAGFNAEGVLRTNNVLTDWRSYAGFNAGYGGSVTPPYPPRATVLGHLLEPHALVQVEAIAHRNGGEATIVQAAGFR